MPSAVGPADDLTPDEQARLAAIRSAPDLAALVDRTDADSEHAAYFAAKREWRELRQRALAGEDRRPGLPGTAVEVGEHPFVVHGVTHADTDAERRYLRAQVDGFLEEGAAVYCEQGIRPMYFADFPSVCEMDDYRWAMDRCRALDLDSHLSELPGEFDSLVEDLNAVATQFRDAVFSLIDAGGERFGGAYARALGDVASAFLMSHEDLATGRDFESFMRSRQAAADPAELAGLQRYYQAAFLPQPLEREWLRRHDPELEIMTHARNARMADYVVHHHDDAPAVHAIVGAAHQPGVAYYLRKHRDGERPSDDFEFVA